MLVGVLSIVGCDSRISNDQVLSQFGESGKNGVVFSLPESLNLYINQEMDLSEYVSPADTFISIEVSDSDVIGVNGTKIEGLKTTGENESVLVTLTSGKEEASTEVSVLSAKDYLSPMFEESISKETDSVSSATFSYADTDVKNNAVLSSSDYDYTFYQDNNMRVTQNGHEYFYSKYDDTKIIKGENYNSSVDFVSLDVVDGETTGIKINKDEADNLFKLAKIKTSNSTNPIDSWGISNYVWDSYFKTDEHFGSDSVKDDVKMMIDGQNISLEVFRYPYFNYGIRDELSLQFDSEGRMLSVLGTTSYYEVNDLESIPEADDGTEVKKESIEANISYDSKEKVDDTFLNYKDYLYKDYTPYFVLDSNNKEEVTAGKVGERLNLKVKNQDPQDASNKIDRAYIEKVEGDGKAKISGINKDLLDLEGAGKITVFTITTLTKIEKQITLDIKKDEYDSIVMDDRYSQVSGYYLPESLLAGQTYSFRTWYKNNDEQEINYQNKTLPDITVSVEGQDKVGLTLTKNTSYTNRYSLKATKEGEVTVSIVDAKLGEAKKITKTLKVYPFTDEGIAQYLVNGSFRQSTGLFKDPFIKLASGQTTKGTVEINTKDGDENSKVTGEWEVKNNKLTIKTPEDIQAAYIKTFEFYSYTDSDYNTTIYYTSLKFSVGNLGGEEDGGYFGVL